MSYKQGLEDAWRVQPASGLRWTRQQQEAVQEKETAIRDLLKRKAGDPKPLEMRLCKLTEEGEPQVEFNWQDDLGGQKFFVPISDIVAFLHRNDVEVYGRKHA